MISAALTATMRRATSGRHEHTPARSGATASTMQACPISTPTLKDASDQPKALPGSPSSRSTPAKPKPWTKPNPNAIGARQSRSRRRASSDSTPT